MPIEVTDAQGVVHEFPDGATPEQMRRAILGDGTQRPPGIEPPGAYHGPKGNVPAVDWGQVGSSALGLLPLAGQTAATLAFPEVSVPLKMLLGGLGMMSGEGGKLGLRAATGQPSVAGPGDLLARLLGAGAMGSLTTGLGEIGPTMLPSRTGAEAMAERAFSPSNSLRGKYPNVSLGRAALEGGVTRTAKGAARAEANITQAASKAEGLVAGKQLSGKTYRLAELAGPRIRAFFKTEGRLPNQAEMRAIHSELKQDLDAAIEASSGGGYQAPPPASPARPGPVSPIIDPYGRPIQTTIPAVPAPRYKPLEVRGAVQQAANKGSATYRASNKGAPIPPGSQATLAGGGRQALNRSIPGYQKAQADVAKARAVNEMTTQAMSRPLPMMPARVDFTKFPPTGSIRPDIASQLALMAFRFDPTLAALLRFGMRGVPYGSGALLQGAMDAPPDTTSAR